VAPLLTKKDRNRDLLLGFDPLMGRGEAFSDANTRPDLQA